MRLVSFFIFFVNLQFLAMSCGGSKHIYDAYVHPHDSFSIDKKNYKPSNQLTAFSFQKNLVNTSYLYINKILYEIKNEKVSLTSDSLTFVNKSFNIGNGYFYHCSNCSNGGGDYQLKSIKNNETVKINRSFIYEGQSYLGSHLNGNLTRLGNNKFAVVAYNKTKKYDTKLKNSIGFRENSRIFIYSYFDSAKIENCIKGYTEEDFYSRNPINTGSDDWLFGTSNRLFWIKHLYGGFFYFDLNTKQTNKILFPKKYLFKPYKPKQTSMLTDIEQTESQVYGSHNMEIEVVGDTVYLYTVEAPQDKEYLIMPQVKDMNWHISVYNLKTKQWIKRISFDNSFAFSCKWVSDGYLYVRKKNNEELIIYKYKI